MKPAETSQSISAHLKAPEVILDSSLESAPYSVQINPDNLSNLVQFAGANVERIVFKRGGHNETIFGPGMANYNSLNNTITERTEWAWRKRERLRSVAHGVISGDSEESIDFYEGVSGIEIKSPHRLTRYLKEAPEERARKFIDLYIDQTVTTMLNTFLLHELQHAHDRFSKWKVVDNLKNSAIFLVGFSLARSVVNEVTDRVGVTPEAAMAEKSLLYLLALVVFKQVLYSLSIEEKRARDTQRKLKEIDGWKAVSIVSKSDEFEQDTLL